ncbi:hypothetical protein NX059_007394 [Plenodomus lindquistii]|nr:hypothetical protein NX059_007394 [Plenodomus lindquistii]
MCKPPPTTSHYQPQIHHISKLIAAPNISETIRTFVNKGYRYCSPENASHWDTSVDRLTDVESFHKALGHRGLIAVIYHPDDSTFPIACAAASPWDGGYDGAYSPEELDNGWEIKIVTTKEEWMGRGLAGICVDALLEEIVRVEGDAKQKPKFWVQAVECLNGAFWRKRGWSDVRGINHEAGRFGSKKGYRLLVLSKEIDG